MSSIKTYMYFIYQRCLWVKKLIFIITHFVKVALTTICILLKTLLLKLLYSIRVCTSMYTYHFLVETSGCTQVQLLVSEKLMSSHYQSLLLPLNPYNNIKMYYSHMRESLPCYLEYRLKMFYCLQVI